jgi:hypothetical protein
MKMRTILASVTALLFTTVAAFCFDQHEDHAAHSQVGNINFSNSCAPTAQADMRHLWNAIDGLLLRVCLCRPPEPGPDQAVFSNAG